MTPRFSLLMMALVAALLLQIGYDGIRLAQHQRFNNALGSDDAASIGGSENAHRQFARAYSLQQKNDFKAAVRAYAEIEARPLSGLQMDIKFNLANLYFREALLFREAGDDDLAMPLIELAKQNYREILRADSSNWDARYNLELALNVAPDMDPVDPEGERNPERSPRAITKTPSRDELP